MHYLIKRLKSFRQLCLYSYAALMFLLILNNLGLL